MDTNARIRSLMTERGWTEYRLAKNADLSQSTIINIFRRNTVPSIATLERICHAFGISLSEFFAEAHPEQDIEQELLYYWKNLNIEQQKAIITLLKTIL